MSHRETVRLERSAIKKKTRGTLGMRMILSQFAHGIGVIGLTKFS